MAKRKRTKGQTMIYKTLHRKLKIEQHGGELMCSGRVNSFFSPCGTRCVTLVTSFSLTVENGAAQSVKILIPMDIKVIISDQIYL
jgi:hypothetical protein